MDYEIVYSPIALADKYIADLREKLKKSVSALKPVSTCIMKISLPEFIM